MAWCGHARCGGCPAAASRRRGEICREKHCNLIPRKALAAGEATTLCTLAARSTWVRQSDRQAVDRAACLPCFTQAVLQNPKAMAADVSQRERSPSASTQSQQPPQEEGAALQEGTTWPARKVLAQRLAICCQRVAQDGCILVGGLRYGVWRYRDGPRHPHGFLTTLHQSLS
jgi:hypothetical protein